MEWISVDKRLPKKSMYVFTYHPDYGFGYSYYKNYKECIKDWVGTTSHWMIPEPPTFDNSDYMKCTNEVFKYVTDNICDDGITKKEICALVAEFCDLYDGDLSNEAVSLLLTKLRELSAVQ